GAITVSRAPAELDSGLQRIKAVRASGSIKDFERPIPLDIARRIVRHPSGGGWKFVSRNVLDQQTLRGVQRITGESASLLDSLIGFNGAFILDGNLYPDELDAGYSYIEGAVTQVLVNRYERDSKARKACL